MKNLDCFNSIRLTLAAFACLVAVSCESKSPKATGVRPVKDSPPTANSMPDNPMPGGQLPDCNWLFAKYFDADQQLRPDMALNTAPHRATPEVEAGAIAKLDSLRMSSQTNWPKLFGANGNPTIAWVAAFDRHYNRGLIQGVIDRSLPNDDDNEYVRTCGEFGMVLAAALKQEIPELEWRYAAPYWDSALLDPTSTYRINVFHWAIKKMSEYGVDDGFEAKIHAARVAIEDARKKVQEYKSRDR